MNKEEIKERKKEIVTFIYENKISLIRHIEGLFFDSYSRARNYLALLEAKGLLKSTTFKHFGGEKVYFLSYKGIDYLKNLGLDATRYKIHENELTHDVTVLDILVYFLKHKGIVNFTTDYRLRRIRKKENATYRVPDFIFTDSEGKSGYLEYELSDKPRAIIKRYIEDYISYYPAEFLKYFIVKPSKQRMYLDILSELNINNYFVGNFNLKDGLELFQAPCPVKNETVSF